jgi:hypothetical protein
MASSAPWFYHQSHLDRRDNLLTRNAKLVALSQVMVHTGMAVGCRRGTHRQKFFHPLVNRRRRLMQSRSKVPFTRETELCLEQTLPQSIG